MGFGLRTPNSGSPRKSSGCASCVTWQNESVDPGGVSRRGGRVMSRRRIRKEGFGRRSGVGTVWRLRGVGEGDKKNVNKTDESQGQGREDADHVRGG